MNKLTCTCAFLTELQVSESRWRYLSGCTGTHVGVCMCVCVYINRFTYSYALLKKIEVLASRYWYGVATVSRID